MLRQSFYHFLLERFDTTELSRLMSFEYPQLRPLLPSTSASHADFTMAVVLVLEQHGAIDDALFDLLVRERPRFRAQIEELRALARAVLAGDRVGPDGGKVVVSFLAANPFAGEPLALESEKSRIEDVLHESTHGGRALLQAFWGVTLATLPDLLRRYQPTILHFSGHGAEGGALQLEGPDGSPRPLDGDALEQLLLGLPRRPQMIVLNACYSARNAAPLTRCVDIIVGASHEVRDDAAALFAEKLYGELGEGRSVRAAFHQGKRAVKTSFPGEEVLLQLNFAADVDPEKVVFFGP